MAGSWEPRSANNQHVHLLSQLPPPSPLSLPLVIALHRSHLSLIGHQLGGTGLLSPALPAATPPSVRLSLVGRVDIATAASSAVLSPQPRSPPPSSPPHLSSPPSPSTLSSPPPPVQQEARTEVSNAPWQHSSDAGRGSQLRSHSQRPGCERRMILHLRR